MTRRRLARLSILAAMAAAVAVPAQAAAVEDIQPTATVSIKLGAKARECVAGRCLYRGGRKATVTWSSSCNVSDPGLNHETGVGFMARLKRAGAKPVPYGSDAISVGEGGEGASGSAQAVVSAGVRLYVDVTVSCSYTTTDADGNSVTHTGKTTAVTPDVLLPPSLSAHNFPRNSFCGVNVTSRQSSQWAQAGGYGTLLYDLQFSALSLLGSNTVSAHAAGVRLHGKGAGLNFKVKPTRSGLRRGEYETSILPRRGGTLKIWASVGGVKTNTRRIKVLPKRC